MSDLSHIAQAVACCLIPLGIVVLAFGVVHVKGQL